MHARDNVPQCSVDRPEVYAACSYQLVTVRSIHMFLRTKNVK
eukprot:jgi/Botrbrau1/9527/Bobra.0211s0018.1